MKQFRFFLLCLTICVFHFYCTRHSFAVNGGGSEVEVTGTVFTSAGVPAKNAQVRLVPQNYNVVTMGKIPDSLTDTTNASGVYSFAKVKPGTYSIQAVQLASRTRLLISGINVSGDTFVAPEGMLNMTGTIKVMLPDTGQAANGYVFVPGTDLISYVNSVNAFVFLDSVPMGIIPVICYGVTNSTKSTVIRYAVSVSSQDTAFVYNPAWKYAKQLAFNTTASGANVTGNVYGFPVLVRLTSANFIFSQAQFGGSDIRFTKADNTFLPYEIERWDSANAVAEIWVKVDTVFGSDSVQSVTMYWSNSVASSMSSSVLTFDTANGFAGVWHLGEQSNSLAGGYKDATYNANNLTGATRTASLGADGIIGRAQYFDTVAADSISGSCPSALSGNKSFTTSFWVKINSLKSTRPCLLDFGVDTYIAGAHFFIWPDFTAQFGMFDTGAFTSPSDPEPPHQNVFSVQSYSGTWMLVAMVYDAALGTLSSYINGTLMDKDTMSAIQINVNGGLHIGRPYADYYPGYFNGDIDELRILSIAESKDWISLCYMNQRSDDKLVVCK